MQTKTLMRQKKTHSKKKEETLTIQSNGSTC